MGYGEVWETLADLVTEFRRRGETIPADVMNDLRAAKTMIEILKADPSHVENIPAIETYIGNVESHLIFTAQKKFGSDFVNHWMEKIKEARRASPKEEAKAALRFVPGLPRGERWVRIQVSKETPRKGIKKLANESGLSYKMQKNGYMLVHGDGEKIKFFVKKIGEKMRVTKEK